MLAAIADARRSVALSTYIFDNDQTGKSFAEALEAAVSRGVHVRVLIDDVGARYSFPSIVRRIYDVRKSPSRGFFRQIIHGDFHFPT